MQPRSIILSSIRAFFISIFIVIGVGIGFTVLILLATLIGTEKELTITNSYYPEIVANAENVRKSLSSSAPVILKLNIDTVIGLESLSMNSVRQQLVESREDGLKKDRVKAILLHVNSPGGTVVDSDAIYRALKAYKAQYKVPIYAYVDGLCASGAFYISLAADKIFSSPSSLIGSVGVLSPTFFNVTQLMEKVGVTSLTLYDGKNKDDMNPFRPWKPGEEEEIKKIINFHYDQFTTLVAENRPKLDKQKLIDIYGANVFPPNEALEYGYIDVANTSLDETLKILAKDIGIEDDFYQVVQMESKLWYGSLLKVQQSALFTSTLKHELSMTPDLSPKLMNQYLFLYRPQ